MRFCKLTTVLFDLDGTLLDTAPDLAFALNQVAQQEGRDPLPLQTIRPVASNGSRGLLGLMFQIDEHHVDYPRLREEFINTYHEHLCVGTKVFSGMETVLQQLENQGIRWGVVTNKPAFLARRLLEKMNLAERCACIVGGDTTSKQKPDPEPLLYACELINSQPKECVYIGDAERDVVAAKKAGMRAIAALYGYLDHNTNPEYWQADYYIDHPRDILTWLDKQILCCQLPY